MKPLLFIWHIKDWLMFYDFGGLVFPDLCSFKAMQRTKNLLSSFFYYSLTENNMKTLFIPKTWCPGLALSPNNIELGYIV